MSKSDRLVLLGGTFDPVHNGHLIVARSVAEHCGFEKVTLLPAARPPHKPAAAASAEHRLAMLRLAIEGDGLFEVSTAELDRGADPPSYTIETIRRLRADRPGLEAYMIIGADMLEYLPRWRDAVQLVREVKFIMARRSPQQQRMLAIWEDVAAKLGPEAAKQIEAAAVDTPAIDISSTDIRKRLKAGLPIRYLVPEAVESYISSNTLYKGGWS